MSEETIKLRFDLNGLKGLENKRVLKVRQLRQLQNGKVGLDESVKLMALCMVDHNGEFMAYENALEILDDLWLDELKSASEQFVIMAQGLQESAVPLVTGS